MTKREFLKELEDRLQMLDEKERKDMIEEYSQHISMCMKSGMKEEEAIEDFGDMDDLIAEILEAYHLDPEYEVKSRERSGKTGIVDLLPKDFFKKKTKIAKAGNKSNVNDENNKSNPRKNRRVEGTKRFKEEQGRKIEKEAPRARRRMGCPPRRIPAGGFTRSPYGSHCFAILLQFLNKQRGIPYYSKY